MNSKRNACYQNSTILLYNKVIYFAHHTVSLGASFFTLNHSKWPFVGVVGKSNRCPNNFLFQISNE